MESISLYSQDLYLPETGHRRYHILRIIDNQYLGTVPFAGENEDDLNDETAWLENIRLHSGVMLEFCALEYFPTLTSRHINTVCAVSIL